ncbi:MAG: flagellar basal body P-ring formation chaperone FlgA [Gammaproteobacteria bacterium]
MCAAAFVLTAAATISGVVAPPVASAEDVLRDELRRCYPHVERWDIRAFDDTRHAAVDGASAQVVRTGARSAVRVGRRIEWFAVSGFQNVVSVSRDLGNGTPLDAAAGHIEERDILATICEPLSDLTALNGMRARRRLRANEVVCVQAIEPRPSVARGETVTVKYVGERVVLNTRGIAKADGNVGDSLLVTNAKSTDSFIARVSGVGEVTVHE